MPHPRLTIRGLRVRAVNLPLARPLQTSGALVGSAPLVLLDLFTQEGVTGSAYLFCYTPLALKPVAQLLANLEPVLLGELAAPLALDRMLQGRFRLLGAKGVVGMALAGIDMAAWDALARAQGLPLVTLLGGAPRSIPAYNSCGLGLIGVERAPVEAQELLASGFSAIKLRLGYADAKTDVAVARAVRSAVGEEVKLMVDYNQLLPVAEACVRAQALAGEGLCWIEEPTLADDYPGHAAIRGKSGIPIQMGENWWGPQEMARCLAAGACDLGMPDAMKIGGVTGWMRAAALAESAALPISSHLFPEVSAHLLAASPTCHWLEYVDWANPVLQEPMKISNGQAEAADAPGSGVAWDEAGVARYLVP